MTVEAARQCGKELSFTRPFLLGPRGRVGHFSFFDCLSPFCFLLIEFHCRFSMSQNTTVLCLLVLYFD